MKLAFIEMSGFRGFKDKTRFDLPAGFAVLTGRNGVGKSTVLDAVDFVMTGTLTKYAVKGAKGGGLDEHVWWVGDGVPASQYVTVGFLDDTGDSFAITRSRERGLDTPMIDIAHRLCIGEAPTESWPEILIQTTLIRDETIAALSLDLPEQARFAAVRAAIGGLVGADHTGRTGALLQAATSAKEEQEARVGQVQADLGRALSALTEVRSIAEQPPDVAEAERIVEALAPDLLGSPQDRAEKLRRRIAERKQSIPMLSEAIALAESLQEERSFFESDAGRAAISTAGAEVEAAEREKEQAEERLGGARRLEALERENDVFASHMVALLEHGEAIGLQRGHCPLCDAVRTSEHFAASIAAARSKLASRGDRVVQAAAVVERARLAAEQARDFLATVQERLARIRVRRDILATDAARVVSTFARWNFGASPSETEAARRLLLRRQEETASLEQAVFILESSGAHDRVTVLEGRIEQLRAQLDDEIAKLTATERALEAAKQIHNGAREVANQVLTEQFDTVMPLLKELYMRLRPHADWREIEIDFGGRVRASLNFTVGEGKNPQFLFSSGQRRAAGIAFLLAMHLSRPWCRLRSLLLDDPVQHIDDYRALNLVEVLAAVRRTGRQVIVAVEDSALADVLCRRLRSTAIEGGRRFELNTAKNGSAAIERQSEIFPMAREILPAAEAS